MIYNYHYSINLSSSLLVPKMFSHHFVYTSFFLIFMYTCISGLLTMLSKNKKNIKEYSFLNVSLMLSVFNTEQKIKILLSFDIQSTRIITLKTMKGQPKKKGTATIVPFTGLSLDFCFVTDIIIKQK